MEGLVYTFTTNSYSRHYFFAIFFRENPRVTE
uniref:Photosystem II T protein n=1 Tax=Euglena hiemalis TaxID=392896 RepID=A0A345UC29_9EUGL|nr:photosystem II T protein [Euglena hiemalis]AXI98015.1 photosystem II T protein [Euglena hiemalis]